MFAYLSLRPMTLIVGMGMMVTSHVSGNSAAVHEYEIRFAPGPKAYPLEIPILSLYRKSEKIADIRLSDQVDTIDEVIYVKDRCIVLGSLLQGAGRSVSLVNLVSGDVPVSVSCFDPVISPDHQYVVFEKWYPRYAPREDIWPTVLAIAISNPQNGPFEVYPKSAVPQDPTVNHCVVSPKVWDAAGGTLAFLDVYGADGDWKFPYKLFCVVVRFKDGKLTQMRKAQVRVDDFVRAGSKPNRVAFAVESLEVSDAVLRGKLYPQSYWLRTDFSFTLDSIEREQVLGINDIHEAGPRNK